MTHNTSSPPASLVPLPPAQPQRIESRAIAMEEALKMQSLLSDWIARSASNRIDTAQLLALGADPSTWGELLHLQEAFAKRLIQQHQTWLEGWAEWAHQRGQITSANTMSKFFEQEFNLVGQIGLLVSDQITNFIALLENAQISYSYWIHEKLHPETSTAAAASRKALRAA